MARNAGFRIHEEVQQALAAERPVVALETTLVTHGLPAPRGIETARAAEAAVRKAGAVPATVAVLDGVVRVGLQAKELEQLAKLGMKSTKAGTRDVAALVATGRTGSTTVAGSMAIALRAGIRFFATGGLGGMHRDWQRTPDASADLFALARTPLAVVSSGFKSVLDVPATWEMLETFGVPVVGYGTEKLPGFYVRDAGIPLEHTVGGPDEAVKLLKFHWLDLGRPEAVIFANPVPAKQALPAKDVEPAVAEAVAAAAKERVTGKALTPFLLDLVVAKLGDEALDANAALIVGNAKAAAEIAVAFAGKVAGPANRAGF